MIGIGTAQRADGRAGEQDIPHSPWVNDQKIGAHGYATYGGKIVDPTARRDSALSNSARVLMF